LTFAFMKRWSDTRLGGMAQGRRTGFARDRRADFWQKLRPDRRYPSCAVDAYAEGEYVAFIPWETLKQFLAPVGQHIFGGARSRGDEDDQR